MTKFAALLLALLATGAQAKGTGLAYVSSEKDNAITLVDAKTLAIVGTIKTCKRPRHMQLLPGETQLIVACGDSQQADVIDLATRKSVGKVPLGEDPEIPRCFGRRQDPVRVERRRRRGRHRRHRH